jgi:Arc/MetJ family transcription regulator
MRITIDIEDNQMVEIQKITGQKKKSPAVTRALEEFLSQHKRQKFIDRVLSGQTDFALTNDELEARDVYETH